MFLSKLNAARGYLTPSETKAADYLIHHLNEVNTITSQQLAESAGIGQSTIIRFSKKLGYDSFREMLADLSKAQVKESMEEEIDVEESAEKTLKKIVRQVQDIVSLSQQANDAETLQSVAELLRNASMNILFGVGSSGLFVEYLANQLIKLGLPCMTSTSAHSIYIQIEHAQQNTVVFLLSESGKTQEVLKAARLAKERGLLVIAMTRGKKNPLHDLADYLLETISFETLTRLNVTTMRCSQLFLIDALYLLIMKSDFGYYDSLAERAEELIQL